MEPPDIATLLNDPILHRKPGTTGDKRTGSLFEILTDVVRMNDILPPNPATEKILCLIPADLTDLSFKDHGNELTNMNQVSDPLKVFEKQQVFLLAKPGSPSMLF